MDTTWSGQSIGTFASGALAAVGLAPLALAAAAQARKYFPTIA